jgi:hypothetical protein
VLAATLYEEILIGTISSGISDQLKDVYSICRCCWNVATYYGKFTLGKMESFFVVVKFHSQQAFTINFGV